MLEQKKLIIRPIIDIDIIPPKVVLYTSSFRKLKVMLYPNMSIFLKKVLIFLIIKILDKQVIEYYILLSLLQIDQTLEIHNHVLQK
ncbi:hypothetical protein pb186bvf_016849 [Paramecium bursaria]